jgi:integrase
VSALSAEEAASPLARRPYNLRHAAVSTWLNVGVDPAQVAEWAGHSVAVLMRVYAK